MHRGLRIDVVDRDAVLVLVRELGGDLTVDDFLENRFGHGGNSPRMARMNADNSDPYPRLSA
jgi:hypothetical protein